jgi:hypothetical protein
MFSLICGIKSLKMNDRDAKQELFVHELKWMGREKGEGKGARIWLKYFISLYEN